MIKDRQVRGRGGLKPHSPMCFIAGAVAVIALGLLGTAIVVFSGAYNIGADAPHASVVYTTLETLRDRSVAVHSKDVSIPADLRSPKRISTGAGLYAEMCSQCHLGPGLERTEISQGLYPAAPELARETDLSPQERFWVIKHGVKLTAMPAWGRTHDDELIWDMVAFLGKLPKMSPDQYRAAVSSAPADHDEMMSEEAGDHAHSGAMHPHSEH